MMEPVLTDTDAISQIAEKIRQQDKGLWAKIKDWISGLVEKLKNAYKDLTPDSAIARQTREIVTQSEEILNAWVNAAADAIANYNLQDGQKNNTPVGVQYSIRNTSRMEWEDQLKAYRNNKMMSSDSFFLGNTPAMYGDKFAGYPLVMNQKDYRKSKSEKHNVPNRVLKQIPNLLSRPIMIFTQGDRLAVVLHEIDGDGKPLVAALHANEQMDRQSVTAVTSIYGVDNWERWLGHQAAKDITIVDKERANNYLQTYGSNASVEDAIRSTGDSLSDGVKNVNPENTLFSSRNVQQTKNLVALHNITEEKFLKSLELGGFPMPSIAVTKADIPHTNFGEITVVFGRETIDPKANRKNTVYSADAWTPTVPQVEYEADSKVTSRVYKQLSGLRNQVDEYFRSALARATYDMENALNRYGGEEGLVQAALDNYGVKAAYLEEQGQHITPETKQETVGTPVSEEMQERYVKIMDILGVDTPEQIAQLILKEVREQHGAELEAVYPGITKSALRLGGLLNRMKAWLQGDNGVETRTVTDVTATQNAVDSAIDKTQFETWVRNLYQGVEKSSGVYNGKPRFTEAGNSRTFKQTHLPATLEGIVKAMAAQNNGNTKNVSGFNGVKTLRAGTAERFSSIADMHKMEGRLQNLTQEQQDEIHDSLSTRLYDAIKAIDDEAGTNPGGRNSLIRYDTIGEILMEIAESGSYNVADIQRVFQQYGKTISDETAIAAKEVLFDISHMPVNIFEAKPERAVGFNEIKNVLVPDNASRKLLQELDQRGIPYQTYQAGNEEQRRQMVQDMEDIRFSMCGVNRDGIEVYETSDEVKVLPYKFRQKKFLDIMANEYRGRTAKFVRNGSAYYAAFETGDVNKNIYGDKRSDTKGWKAKVNIGADGNIFELVENATYAGSRQESGKDSSLHRSVDQWDYFVKNVQIDGTVYDLLANVRKRSDGEFVYSIQLRQNKKIKASPPLDSRLRASNGVLNAFVESIHSNPENVNLYGEKFSDVFASHRMTGGGEGTADGRFFQKQKNIFLFFGVPIENGRYLCYSGYR